MENVLIYKQVIMEDQCLHNIIFGMFMKNIKIKLTNDYTNTSSKLLTVMHRNRNPEAIRSPPEM